MSDYSERFAQDLAEVDWKALRIHLQRDALILVTPELDLINVACQVAEDRSAQVEEWINGAKLRKPTAEQLQQWESCLDKPFRMLIVAPYILIQEGPDAE